MKYVGSRIKEIRKKNALTQKEFGKRICLSQSHLSRIEHNLENPSKPAIRLISILFNADENWLLGVNK